MSKFLGPIHFWLYNKIKVQDSLTRFLADKIFGHEAEAVLKGSQLKWGSLPGGNLEESIDTANIHGWLQEQIGVVEKNMAQITSDIKDAEGSLDKAESLAFEFGSNLDGGEQVLNHQEALEQGQYLLPSEGYQLIENLILSGMPCDRVNNVLEKDENHLRYEQTSEIHKAFWDEAGGDVADYYRLRDAMVRGILLTMGLDFVSEGGNVYEIRRKEC